MFDGRGETATMGMYIHCQTFRVFIKKSSCSGSQLNNKEKPLSEFTRRHETARRLGRHAGSETCNGGGTV